MADKQKRHNIRAIEKVRFGSYTVAEMIWKKNTRAKFTRSKAVVERCKCILFCGISCVYLRMLCCESEYCKIHVREDRTSDQVIERLNVRQCDFAMHGTNVHMSKRGYSLNQRWCYMVYLLMKKHGKLKFTNLTKIVKLCKLTWVNLSKHTHIRKYSYTLSYDL